jgi:hypothetical protein
MSRGFWEYPSRIDSFTFSPPTVAAIIDEVCPKLEAEGIMDKCTQACNGVSPCCPFFRESSPFDPAPSYWVSSKWLDEL